MPRAVWENRSSWYLTWVKGVKSANQVRTKDEDLCSSSLGVFWLVWVYLR